MEEKASIRWAVRSQLRGLSADQRACDSEQVCRLLQLQDEWQRAAGILFYAPLWDEIDLSSLIPIALRAGKTVALPQFDAQAGVYRAGQIETPLEGMTPGKFGILEPSPDSRKISLNQLDLALVPGVAFDLSGHRLGRGRGFYDRLLAQFRGVKCGVAYDEQMKPQIPVAPHDILLDCIVLPSRWLDCRPGWRGDDLVG